MRFNSLTLRADYAQGSFIQNWHMNRALRAKDVERILGLVGRMRHREHPASAALKLEESHRGVLDLSREQNLGGHRFHLSDRSEDTGKHLDPMTTEIKHGSTTSFLPVHQPGPQIIHSSIERLQGIDLRHHRRSDLT